MGALALVPLAREVQDERPAASSGGYNTQQVAAAINGAYSNYLAYLQQYNGINGLTGANGWPCNNSGCSV